MIGANTKYQTDQKDSDPTMRSKKPTFAAVAMSRRKSLMPHHHIRLAISFVVIVALLPSCSSSDRTGGKTEICKWQDCKRGAVSITFDDAPTTQFTVAVPILNKLGLKGTFYVMTGNLPGSIYNGQFIGRPAEEIIAESAHTPTDSTNFFERASAAGFLGYKGTLPYHTRAGALYESGKKQEAYAKMDELYQKVRNGEFERGHEHGPEVQEAVGIGWEDFKKFAAQGHEIASHTITHPRLAALDEPNLLYEMEKSKEEIERHLGDDYTFSFEGPYGTENERVMKYALEIYEATRNRMPEPFLEELNRSSKKNPRESDKEYVQWQRGPLSKTSLELMKSWVDSVAIDDNIWLVLVFHGVDHVGWEALPSTVLEEYFTYIKNKQDSVWIATFWDVTRYMRERMHGKVETREEDGRIAVELTHSLDKDVYNVPLTLKTYVPSTWKKVRVGDESAALEPQRDSEGTFVVYRATPNAQTIELTPATEDETAGM